MDDHDFVRALVARSVTDEWQENPPDHLEWARALSGCAELYEIAGRHLTTDPPNYLEAMRALKVALDLGHEVAEQARLGYILSGQATDDFLTGMSESMQSQDPE